MSFNYFFFNYAVTIVQTSESLVFCNVFDLFVWKGSWVMMSGQIKVKTHGNYLPYLWYLHNKIEDMKTVIQFLVFQLCI